jgi:hypothetical protein
MAIDLSSWNEPGLDPLPPPPEDFSGLSVEDAAELIKDWFLANFEDPAQETPYDGREGGYLYIHGGPYEVDDVIGNVFAGVASDEIIQAAVEAVELEGFEWAPAGHRVQPPDDDDTPESPTSDVRALHAQMLERISVLEQAAEKVPRPGRGHNHPPEPLEDEPLTAVDFQDLFRAIETLKAQPVEPANTPADAIEAANILHLIGAKVSSYLKDKGDVFVTEAVKEAGKWAIRLPVWGVLLKSLVDAGNAVMTWVHALHLPF